MGKLVYVRNKKTKPGLPGQRDGTWPEKKRMEVLTTFLATGNLSLAASMCNVPYDTCSKWKTTTWWKEAEESIRDEENIALDAKLSKTLARSLDAVNDRIENGEYELDRKTGKLVRVPVRLRDVHKVSADLIDRQQLIRKKPQQVTANQESTDGRLLKLAEAFAQLALGKQTQEKIVNEVYEHETDLPEEYLEAMSTSQET